MLVTLGGLALPLAVFFALYAGVIAVVGALRGRAELVRSAERAVIAVFALLVLAMLGVEAALVGDRFDLAFWRRSRRASSRSCSSSRSGAARPARSSCGRSCWA